MINLPKHHGAGRPEARGPMQLHRLHRLKAGPRCHLSLGNSVRIPSWKFKSGPPLRS